MGLFDFVMVMRVWGRGGACGWGGLLYPTIIYIHSTAVRPSVQYCTGVYGRGSSWSADRTRSCGWHRSTTSLGARGGERDERGAAPVID